MSASEKELIRRNKQLLGPLAVLDCSGMDTVEAHRRLGEAARAQIHKFLAHRLNDQEGPAHKIRRARSARIALGARLGDPRVDEPVRAAIGQYQACLSAWAAGARLAEFQHALLPGQVDDLPVHADDLALILQEDQIGCQTGIFRAGDGAAILWHSEEDPEAEPGLRFDRLRLFLFRGAGERLTWGFIYPDLLPGPTFGWQAGGYAQAVDTLHVRPAPSGGAILPNTLAWLSLYIGGQVSPGQLAERLGPFQGGYSLTSARREAGRVKVEKAEFANGQVTAGTLDESSGCFFFQTNILNDLGLPIGAEEQTSPENRAWNATRVRRTHRLIGKYGDSDNPLEMVFRLLRSGLGGDSAYANRDVKAYFVCRMAPGKTAIWVGPGAALPGDEMFTLEL